MSNSLSIFSVCFSYFKLNGRISTAVIFDADVQPRATKRKPIPISDQLAFLY